MPEPKRGQNSFMRLSTDLEIEKGLNLRQPTEEAIEEKLQSIISNGVITDFQVFKKHGNERYTIVEGHTRYLAICLGILKGLLPADFLIPCKSIKVTSDQALTYLILTANNGVSIPPLGKALGYKRLMDYGQTIQDIVKELGVSAQHIKDSLILLNANHGLQDMVKTGKVSATLVSGKLKTQSSDSIEAEISHALTETGKSKVTAKNLPKSPVTAKVKQARIDKEISAQDQFRTWLSSEGLTEVLKKFNEIFS